MSASTTAPHRHWNTWRAAEMLRMSARRLGAAGNSGDTQITNASPFAERAGEEAVASLDAQGVLTRTDTGWVATPVVRMRMTDLVPTDLTPAHGRITIREIVHRVVPATPVVRHRLATDDEDVLLVEQLVSLGGEPLFHAVGYSPIDTAEHVSATIRALDRHPKAIDMAELFRTFFGIGLGKVVVDVGALRADLRTARLLKLEQGAGTLVREFWQYDTAGRARSYNFTQFRPDRVQLVADSAGSGTSRVA